MHAIWILALIIYFWKKVFIGIYYFRIQHWSALQNSFLVVVVFCLGCCVSVWVCVCMCAWVCASAIQSCKLCTKYSMHSPLLQCDQHSMVVAAMAAVVVVLVILIWMLTFIFYWWFPWGSMYSGQMSFGNSCISRWEKR